MIAMLTMVAAMAVVVMTEPAALADTGAACTALYTIGWQTPTNSPPDFGATVTVKNNATYPINGWTITWDFPVGQSYAAGSVYSANMAQVGTRVTATPAGSYNANLAPGASTTFGFKGYWNGTSNPVPTTTCTGPSQGSSSHKLAGPLEPLGVNTASWDTNFVDPAIATYLSNAKAQLIRYPGGSWAEEYDWQTNQAKGEVMPVDFAAYSNQVNAAGGQKFVTINYGTGTPASAGAWAAQAKATAGQGVALRSTMSPVR